MACQMASSRLFGCVLLCFIIFATVSETKEKSNDKKDGDPKQDWKKKDIRDYSEADLERLYQQWEEEDDEPLEEDEKPEWEKEPPPIDMSKLDPNNPEAMLEMSKKGRTLMMFATISGNPTEKETETISGLWQSSLHNGHFGTQRFVVGTDRVIFMLEDGSKAWAVKDFLITQDRCAEVTIEGKSYPGKAAQGAKESPNDNRPSKKPKDEDKNKKQKKSENEVVKEKKDQKDKKKEKNKTEL